MVSNCTDPFGRAQPRPKSSPAPPTVPAPEPGETAPGEAVAGTYRFLTTECRNFRFGHTPKLFVFIHFDAPKRLSEKFENRAFRPIVVGDLQTQGIRLSIPRFTRITGSPPPPPPRRPDPTARPRGPATGSQTHPPGPRCTTSMLIFSRSNFRYTRRP